MTAAASWSSASESSRCSRVAYSCLRWLAYATARCRVSSRLREKDGKEGLSILFHSALQRVLMTTRRVHHLGDLGFGHLVGENAANTHAMLVNMQHDSRGFFPG